MTTITIWFQSTPSGGKATFDALDAGIAHPMVSIHAFRGEGDRERLRIEKRIRVVSIHAFRGEGDRQRRETFRQTAQFQSTPSGGKATRRSAMKTIYHTVSIHAFRGEGDVVEYGCDNHLSSFQSTPSGGKATFRTSAENTLSHRFQSTPSGGKATETGSNCFPRYRRFNPRLPGGRRP